MEALPETPYFNAKQTVRESASTSNPPGLADSSVPWSKWSLAFATDVTFFKKCPLSRRPCEDSGSAWQVLSWLSVWEGVDDGDSERINNIPESHR